MTRQGVRDLGYSKKPKRIIPPPPGVFEHDVFRTSEEYDAEDFKRTGWKRGKKKFSHTVR